MILRSLCLLALCVAAPACLAQSRVGIVGLHLPPLPLGVINFPNGKAVNLTVGVGTGAFHSRHGPPGRIWLVTDRGPSIACAEAPRLVGLDARALCAGMGEGRILALPGFTPTIYGFDIIGGRAVKLAVTLPLKGRSGRPVTGLANPSRHAEGEPCFDPEGRKLATNPSGVDPAALVQLADGSFWIAESFAPSLLHVGADGTVLERLVPQGLGHDLAEADYPVRERLPAIFARRQPERGFGGLALSPDEHFLYAVLKAPLANPDRASGTGSRNLRILRVALASEAPVAEYLYTLDPPENFKADAGMAAGAGEVTVRAALAIGPERLMLLERVDRGVRLYAVDLRGAVPVPTRFDDPETRPTLENLSGAALAPAGLHPLSKHLVLDGDKVPGLPRRLDGLAMMSARELIAVNDNDFGIRGEETRMLRLLFHGRRFK